MRRKEFMALAACLGPLLTPLRMCAATRAAIIAEGDQTIPAGYVARFYTELSRGLIRQVRYEVVERSRLAMVLREQGLSNSAYSDPRSAASLGKLLGASRIVDVQLSADDDSTKGPFLDVERITVSASYSIISVNTARVLDAGTASGNGQRTRSRGNAQASVPVAALLREAVDHCANDLVEQLAQSR